MEPNNDNATTVVAARVPPEVRAFVTAYGNGNVSEGLRAIIAERMTLAAPATESDPSFN